MTEHTPGPWKGDYEIIGNSRIVATMAWCSGMEAEDSANACLVCAAPEMLEALREMVTWMPSGFAPESKSRAMNMAYDAIAKAEGRNVETEAP